MKKIDEFVVNKVNFHEENTIELFTEIDSEPQRFMIEISKSSDGLLAKFSKELEFLLRANDILLNKNFMKFLKQLVEKRQLEMPFNLFSKSKEKTPRKLRPRHLQTA